MPIQQRLLEIIVLAGAVVLTLLFISNRLDSLMGQASESAILRNTIVETRDAGTLVKATHSGSDGFFSTSYTLVETSKAFFKTETVAFLIKGQSLHIQKRANSNEYLCSEPNGENGEFCYLIKN